MAHGRTLLAALAALTLGACGAPEAEGPIAEAQAAIVGGVDDVFRSYVVGVGTPYDSMDPDATGTGPFCSGTLVSRRTVITAARCVTPSAGPQGGITAVFFGPDLRYPLPGSATVVGTVQTVVHPDFDASTLSDDLAMVELESDAPSQAVPLLRETMANTPEYLGPRFTFVGYGSDGDGGQGIRRVATFPIARVGPACVGLDTGTGPIDATEFYYRVAGQDTCTGDSGGPALLPDGPVERLAGARSTGDAACAVDGADARTDAPQIAAFIQPTIDLFEGADPCRADGTCDESCNTGHQLVDPDCAPAHCGADGICVLSCVDAPDPDCAAVGHCGPDGVCDPGCSPGTRTACPRPPARSAPAGAAGPATGGPRTPARPSRPIPTSTTAAAARQGAGRPTRGESSCCSASGQSWRCAGHDREYPGAAEPRPGRGEHEDRWPGSRRGE